MQCVFWLAQLTYLALRALPLKPKLVRLVRLALVLSSLLLANPVNAQGIGFDTWQAGRLDYAYGGAEVAAFVNTKEQVQLQIVLCSKEQPYAFRMSVLCLKSIMLQALFPSSSMSMGV